MYNVGQIVSITGLGKFKIEDSHKGCTDCANIDTDIDKEPCKTCACICMDMGRSNIKLSKVFEGDLDEYLKYHQECGSLDR